MNSIWEPIVRKIRSALYLGILNTDGTQDYSKPDLSCRCNNSLIGFVPYMLHLLRLHSIFIYIE